MKILNERIRDDGPCADELLLAFDMRVRSRVLARTEGGVEVGVMLTRGGAPLADGDVLTGADGTRVRVRAKAEELLHVTVTTPQGLARAAYHLGNRHVRVEVGPDWLRLAADPVLEAMLVQLGAGVVRVTAPFSPEHGAYGGGHHHSHGDDPALHYAPRIHQFGEPSP